MHARLHMLADDVTATSALLSGSCTSATDAQLNGCILHKIDGNTVLLETAVHQIEGAVLH
jgi:hypothetical protein